VPASRRLLLVHAHPDDESISTGATMARYAAQGAQVTLVTCTLGEEGEILVPELAQLSADQADQLGGYRIGELAQAMQALGVTDHRFLGGPGRFRDSGMMGTEEQAPQSVLASRFRSRGLRRGSRRRRGGDPRSPSSSRDHLRRQRRLRAS
jgi:N-acetyl-1-D-myo-inositol-2-amino-2-deoxy-alpha-D-glucopyranoside deacetylase